MSFAISSTDLNKKISQSLFQQAGDQVLVQPGMVIKVLLTRTTEEAWRHEFSMLFDPIEDPPMVNFGYGELNDCYGYLFFFYHTHLEQPR